MATKEENTKGGNGSIELSLQFNMVKAKIFAVADALSDGADHRDHIRDYYVGNSQILYGVCEELKEIEDALSGKSA